MPKLPDNQLPSLRLHKQSGQAIVTLSGRDHLLGPHGSVQAELKYRKLTAEWQARRGHAPTAKQPAELLTVAELLSRFLRHAQAYYRKNGVQTSEYSIYLLIMRPLRDYGDLPVIEFSPLKLSAVINEMVRLGWKRKSINNHIHRLRHIFQWGVATELVPESVPRALKCVPALRKGRTEAGETPKVRPVSDEDIDAVLPHVSRQIAAMIQLHRLTGMRPSEVCIIRGCDIDMEVTAKKKGWEYTPSSHKNEHHDQDHTVVFGQRCQQLLEPFLKVNPQDYLFSPADARDERIAKRHAARKTPLKYGNAPGTNRKRKPQRGPGDRYTEDSYRTAVARGCELAFGMPAELYDPRTKAARAADTLEKRTVRRTARAAWHELHVWSPNQLRHTCATKIREKFDDRDAAQAVLGHLHGSTTEIYTERNLKRAREVMADVG